MKKFIDKLEHNKFFFAVFMIIVFALFKAVTTGFTGALGHNGIVGYINNLPNITDSGKSIFGEMIWALCLIPVIIIFKNKYIFSQKKIPFKERFKVMLPMLIVTTVMLLQQFISGGGFSNFNFPEVLSMLLLYAFVGVYEEILCRGWILNEFLERFGNNRKGVIYSIILSALIFGFMHFTNIFAGADTLGTFVQIIMASLIGIYYGCVYLKTKNIWSVIFLHSYWDFAVSLGDMNVTSSCFQPSLYNGESGVFLIIITIVAGIVNLAFQLPGFFESLKILTKSSINEMLPQKGKIELTELEKKADRTKNKIFTIFEIVSVSVISSFLLLGVSFFDEDVCMQYPKKEITSYEFSTVSYDSYDMLYTTSNKVKLDDDYIQSVDETNSIKLKYKGNELFIGNVADKKYDVIKYDDEIYNLSVFKNNNKYIITVLVRCETGTLVYYCEVLIDNMASSNIISDIKDGFKKLELPIIIKSGYYTTQDGLRYPLFVSYYNRYYILDDNGKINELVQKID